MKKFLSGLNPMLLDLAAGCIVYGILGEILILAVGIPFYEGPLWKIILGFLVGIAAAVAITAHMYRSVAEALSLGETGAPKHTRKMFIFRAAGLLLLLALIYFTGFCDAIAFAVGLLSLKVAAYLQPITHKYIVTKITK
ncbi:MAG: hypothetical protein NC086_09030 [Alistipes sp.]|nr:hypothetical protein [Alistipes sp.]